MRKTLFAVLFSVFLTLSCVSFQKDSSQIPKSVNKKEVSPKALASKTPITDDSESDDQYTRDGLRPDIRIADVVAYVDVKEAKNTGRDVEATDCENKGGPGGYCFYELTAEVKEVFKGKVETKSLEFGASADSSYEKENFLGERVVFLISTDDQDKEGSLLQMENSSRSIEHNVLEKIRAILDPNSPIDENDQREPYSRTYISQNFKGADVVIYANVLSFKSNKSKNFDDDLVTLKAGVKEVFKGSLEAGQTFEYKVVPLHQKDVSMARRMRREDLGEQILYLRKYEENGKVIYVKIEETEGRIEHNILEKLRKIAKEAPTAKY
jgi:hypothetical protein